MAKRGKQRTTDLDGRILSTKLNRASPWAVVSHGDSGRPVEAGNGEISRTISRRVPTKARRGPEARGLRPLPAGSETSPGLVQLTSCSCCSRPSYLSRRLILMLASASRIITVAIERRGAFIRKRQFIDPVLSVSPLSLWDPAEKPERGRLVFPPKTLSTSARFLRAIVNRLVSSPN